MKQRTTIRDVARQAGVSVGTVSRVVNGHPSVTDAKRRVVLQVIADLGFQPDTAAQSLRRGTNRTLGVFIPDLRNPFFAELMQRIAHPDDIVRAHEAGKHGTCLTMNGVPLPGRQITPEEEVSLIRIYAYMGVRMMHLTYNRVNPIGGGCGRFSAISSENWPLVRPIGRSASSKRRASARAARCACRQRLWSRTNSVAS